MENIEIEIVDSFVFNSIKNQGTTGAGESKLHLTTVNNESSYDDFFNNYTNITCKFDIENLTTFLNNILSSYVPLIPINKSKDILKRYIESYIQSLNNYVMTFNITKYIDATRYYIRSDDYVFNDLLRKIAIPYVTKLTIKKEGLNYKFLLNVTLNETTTTTANLNSSTTTEAENIIFFGSPGTGKSFSADEKTNGYIVEKITFHPEYDYNSFVGGYKPIMNEEDGESKIEYKFVPQIFTNVYVNAWKNLENHHFLQIEEINRGNCAEIFGDLFQLLDRNNDGGSKYEISASEELKTYLIKEFGDVEHEGIKGNKLRLPNNLSIVATMNTSDQSLFPMDSAFKRRWNWEYVPIKYNCKDSDFIIKLDNDNEYKWLDFLKEVNQRIYKATQSQDKQIGNWFINAQNSRNVINEKTFINKVLFYLWNDVFKDEDETIFIKEEEHLTYEHFFAENKTELLEYIFTTNLNLEPKSVTTTNEEEIVEE